MGKKGFGCQRGKIQSWCSFNARLFLSFHLKSVKILLQGFDTVLKRGRNDKAFFPLPAARTVRWKKKWTGAFACFSIFHSSAARKSRAAAFYKWNCNWFDTGEGGGRGKGTASVTIWSMMFLWILRGNPMLWFRMVELDLNFREEFSLRETKRCKEETVFKLASRGGWNLNNR